ncbi:hypothetical protein, partial [Brunnivagina elsteri]|uniref:hypothetical protein n=1 Tax=Brunnivagina elsteri TaxID=1247191 RepID=UPI001304266A
KTLKSSKYLDWSSDNLYSSIIRCDRNFEIEFSCITYLVPCNFSKSGRNTDFAIAPNNTTI